MRLTDNEVKALRAICDSEYQDDKSNPVGHDVWTKYCNPFRPKSTQSGVYASLSKKGLIQVGFLEDGRGRNRMDTVHITQKGYAALTLGFPPKTSKQKDPIGKAMEKLDRRIITRARWLSRFVKKHGGDRAEVLKLFIAAFKEGK